MSRPQTEPTPITNPPLDVERDSSWALFCAYAGSPIGRPEATAALLQQKLTSAMDAWPCWAAEEPELATFLAERLRPDEDALDGLMRLHSDDLLLVRMLLADDARALAAFEHILLAKVGTFVRHLVHDDDGVAEVTRQVRARLLTPARVAGERSLSRYSGRHPLRSWVCTVALRVALDLRRARRRASPPADDDVLAATKDPELALQRARHQAALATALAEACGGLELHSRRLLRLFFAQGFTYRELGCLFQVDETTARRRLLEAKEELLGRVRRLLGTRLPIAGADVESLFGRLESGLHLGLTRLLASGRYND